MLSEKLARVKAANIALKDSLSHCMICPRKCGVDRTKGKAGYCKAKEKCVVYSYSSHQGEEPPISGSRGSGTIFFTHCNMRCVYCQNYSFSQLGSGQETSTDKLSRMMLHLEKTGCHNINLVTPTHFVPQILLALEKALEDGLKIPIVYNTSGYELPETIKLLEGIVDIYLPDMRYSDNSMAKKYSDAPGYADTNRSSIKVMQEQVGDLVMDEAGIAKRGMIIRLLALPGGISGTEDSLKFISKDISKSAYLSIMSQYYPAYKSLEYKELSSGITSDEYANIVDAAHEMGLNNGWVQETPGKTDEKFLGTNIKPRTEI
ncbi:MAG: radical SAM protein [Candidatus Omnitrophota bacterium]